MALVAKCPSSFLKTITFLIIHQFLSLKVLLLIYLLFKKHCIQYISIWKVVLDLVKGTWHHNFMEGCGSLLWANTCSLWSGIKSWPGARCLQLKLRRSCQWPTASLPYVYHRRHAFLNRSLGLAGGKHCHEITIPVFWLVLQNFAILGYFPCILSYHNLFSLLPAGLFVIAVCGSISVRKVVKY